MPEESSDGVDSVACDPDARGRLRVAFVHPDLGIGGAERLVVDAAVALQRRGHDVRVYTTHHDRQHCFPETSNGSLSVTVCGDWLPVTILGAARVLCACVRMLYLSVWLALLSAQPTDVYIVDQVSVCVPVLRWLSGVRGRRARVLFYCHFPDQLLVRGRDTSLLKRIYRAPFDWLEQYTTGLADRVLVNSEFTAQVFQRTFASLSGRVQPSVLYPALDFAAFDNIAVLQDADLCALLGCDKTPRKLLLSLNRFERKKNIGLAVDAFSQLLAARTSESRQFSDYWLVLAGGYDPLNIENVQHFAELQQHCARAGVSHCSTLLKSPDDALKRQLLSLCDLVLYTPDGEHFGIVPLEAMYCRRPVVAVNSGGPRETVEHERTGLLVGGNCDEFAAAAARILGDRQLATDMGSAGYCRVVERFSFATFSDKLENVLYRMCQAKSAT